jgi:hypothetical protein
MEGKHIFREGFRNLPPFSYEGCFIGRGKLSGSVRRAICVSASSEEVNCRGGSELRVEREQIDFRRYGE